MARERVPKGSRRVVDVMGGDAEEAMRGLARAGLAEGECFLRRVSALSAGELFRLRLALAMREAERRRGPVLLLIDEFASTLDPETGRSVAALLRRFVERTPNVRAVIATQREELVAALAPERVVKFDLGHGVEIGKWQAESGNRGGEIRVERGVRGDYEGLAGYHYLGGPPATVVRVLRARARGHERPVGVLVVSMPVLNGPWRKCAWPGEYVGKPRERARLLNDRVRGVRCISRVVVDPRFRGRGVAAGLVRAYLRRPMTRRTEAVAAMGRYSSFFEAAGMRRVETPTAERHVRLMSVLERAGIGWWEVSTPGRTWERALERIGARVMERELRRWAGADRRCAGLGARELWRRACARLAVRAAGFVMG